MEVDEMTVSQAAKALGVTRYRVHAMIRDEQLRAEKRTNDLGVDYLVLKRAQVERMVEERRQILAGERPSKGGRKPNPPPEKTDA